MENIPKTSSVVVSYICDTGCRISTLNICTRWAVLQEVGVAVYLSGGAVPGKAAWGGVPLLLDC